MPVPTSDIVHLIEDRGERLGLLERAQPVGRHDLELDLRDDAVCAEPHREQPHQIRRVLPVEASHRAVAGDDRHASHQARQAGEAGPGAVRPVASAPATVWRSMSPG